jgi:D-alanyl-D-alanine carboxypeptidase
MENGSRGRKGLHAKTALATVLMLAVGLTALSATPAEARRHHHRSHVRTTAVMRAGPADPDKDAALIVDGISGKVLYARNAEVERHPASLTKMMTLYLLFDALKNHQIAMDDTLTFSRHAAWQNPTNMHSRPGQTMQVETAINAIVVRSANDVAVAVAEALGGTEAHFAEMMTAKARALGLQNTVYVNASGLPDPRQVTTANDLALLARHLAYDFPQYFHYFSDRRFVYRRTVYEGHDNLLGRYAGADGIKTGYTGMSGYNLVTSVTRENTHIIGVVMGGRTAASRDAEMMKLMDKAFAAVEQSPALVAHARLPWRTAAQTQVAEASLTVPKPAPAPAANIGRTYRVEPDTYGARMEVEDVTPLPSPNREETVASIPPKATPMPAPRPALRILAKEKEPSHGMHDWTIQIGAYADQTMARHQLAAYAKKAVDILGQAQRIVVPTQSTDGQWLYRARFGPFMEREARQICARLTARGQTCFAAVSTR